MTSPRRYRVEVLVETTATITVWATSPEQAVYAAKATPGMPDLDMSDALQWDRATASLAEDQEPPERKLERREPSWLLAEFVAGCRLDRRRTYTVMRDEVFVDVRYTSGCSDCEGHGCADCGGTGKRRRVEGVPLKYMSEVRRG